MNSDELIASMQDSQAASIAEKLVQGVRISKEEGLELATRHDLRPLQQMADWKRKQVAGDHVFFASTLFIHPTNLCELSCPMCSYYAKPGWEKAWFLTPDQIIAKIKQHLHQELNEIHVVGGLWRDCNLDYYEELFTKIKALNPDLHIKALTPVEYDFLAKLHGLSIEEVFQRMISWGLGSLPGGGAEVLVEHVRKALAPQKISSDEYLAVHKIAHGLGLRSNITILFGGVEEWEDVATHLDRVRTLQDETGGFDTFVPLKYHEENNALGKRQKRLRPKRPETIFALSRILLDNVPNLKALWNYLGIDTAKEALSWGANDLASTSLEEKIITMAGGVQIKMTSSGMEEIIHSIGRLPKKVHSGQMCAC